jgi:hypothetical protein
MFSKHQRILNTTFSHKNNMCEIKWSFACMHAYMSMVAMIELVIRGVPIFSASDGDDDDGR